MDSNERRRINRRVRPPRSSASQHLDVLRQNSAKHSGTPSDGSETPGDRRRTLRAQADRENPPVVRSRKRRRAILRRHEISSCRSGLGDRCDLGAHGGFVDQGRYRASRAGEEPPARPTVKDMSTGQLVARFEDAGIRGYATRFLGGEFEPFDVELYNRIVRETREIVDELNARGGLNELLALLDHSNISVRRTAATYAISVAPDRTLPVLESISASRDLIEASRASATLDRWNDSKKKGAGALQS